MPTHRPTEEDQGQGKLRDDVDRRMEWSHYPDGTLLQERARDKQISRYIYDADGALISGTDVTGANQSKARPLELKVDYDDLDRPVKVRNRAMNSANWNVTSYGYDDNSNLQGRTQNEIESPVDAEDRPGRVAEFTYDTSDRLETFRDLGTKADWTSDDRWTNYDYKPNGWLTLRRTVSQPAGPIRRRSPPRAGTTSRTGWSGRSPTPTRASRSSTTSSATSTPAPSTPTVTASPTSSR